MISRRRLTSKEARQRAGRRVVGFFGVLSLSVSKILENMEVGHNVMHGQYDWTRDPALNARTYEWDTVCTGDDWRHSHNYEHHTFTTFLALFFQWGIGMHDLRIIETLTGQSTVRALGERARPFLKKAAWQLAKDYVF